MRALFILLVFCLSLSETLAQKKERVSGYLGKRLVIGLGAEVSLSKQPQKQSNSTYRYYDASGFNRGFYVHADYVLGNYFSMGLRGGTLSTSVALPFNHFTDDLSWKDSFGTQELTSIHGTPGIRDLSIGFYAKHFFKKSAGLAPFGTYFTWGLNIHRYRLDFSTIRFHTQGRNAWNEPVNNVYKYDKSIGNLNFKEIFIELGKARPLNDFVMIDFSIKSGFLIYGMNLPSVNGKNAVERYVDNLTLLRLRRLCYINYSLKFQLML